MRLHPIYLFFKDNYEYMPLISSVTSFVKIFQLALYGEKNCFFKNRHYTSLKKEKLLRHIVLTVPVFGNVVVGIYDLKKTSQYLLTLKAVTADGLALENTSKENQKCEQIVKAAILQNEKAFKFADMSFRNNLAFIFEIMKDFSLFRFAAPELRGNQEVAFIMMKIYGVDILQYFMEDLLSNERFMEKAMEISVEALKCSKSLRNSKSFVSKMNQRFEKVLKFASKDLRKDFEFVESLMNDRMSCLSVADEQVRSDVTFIKKRMAIDLQALEFSNILDKTNFMVSFLEENLTYIQRLPSGYKSDKQFLKQFKQDDFKVICYAEDTLRHDLNYHIECIDDGLSLRWAIDELKKNEGLVFSFVKKGKVKELEFADEALLTNKIFAKKCILENRDAYNYFHPSLKKCASWILELIEKDEKILSLADAKFQNDKDFALKTIAKNPKAMGECLFRNDETFVLDAIRIDPSSFQFAIDFFRKNPVFVQKAMLICHTVLKFAASDEIMTNPQFFKQALPFDVSIFGHAGDDLRGNLYFIKDYIFKDSGLMDSFLSARMTMFENAYTFNVAKNAEILNYAEESVRDNKEFLFSFVDYGVNPLVYASTKALSDHAFVMKVLRKNRNFFKVLSDDLLCVEEIAIYILEFNLRHYDVLPKKLWKNKTVLEYVESLADQLLGICDQVLEQWMGTSREYLERVQEENKAWMEKL